MLVFFGTTRTKIYANIFSPLQIYDFKRIIIEDIQPLRTIAQKKISSWRECIVPDYPKADGVI